MVCVLAMEQREGEEAQKKANRLIQRHQHLFKGMFATFHPGNIPSEVKGKILQRSSTVLTGVGG